MGIIDDAFEDFENRTLVVTEAEDVERVYMQLAFWAGAQWTWRYIFTAPIDDGGRETLRRMELLAREIDQYMQRTTGVKGSSLS